MVNNKVAEEWNLNEEDFWNLIWLMDKIPHGTEGPNIAFQGRNSVWENEIFVHTLSKTQILKLEWCF